MPREIRKIILDNEELVEAVNSFRRVRDDLLPPGTVLSVQPGEKNGLSVEIEMKFGPNVRRDTFILTNEHVVETIVRFCLENNIPVPRLGKRAARPTDDGWVLQILLQGAEMEHSYAADTRGAVFRTAESVSVSGTA